MSDFELLSLVIGIIALEQVSLMAYIKEAIKNHNEKK